MGKVGLLEWCTERDTVEEQRAREEQIAASSEWQSSTDGEISGKRFRFA